MRKRTDTTQKEKPTITMPDEVDLSTYESLDVSFTDGEGNELLILRFRRDVETWVAARPQKTADDISAPLQVNLAFAALTTAYQTWRTDEPFDGFVSRLRRSLELATPQRSV